MNSKKIVAQVLGAVGAVFLVTSPVLFLFGTPFPSLPVWQAVLGLVCCGAYVALDPSQLGRMLSGKGTFFAATAGGLGLVVIALLGIANYLAATKMPKQWDLTKNKIFTLADDTQRTVKGLTHEIHAYAFYTPTDREYGQVKDLLERYHDLSPTKFVFEFLDPDKDPSKVRAFNIKKDSGPALVVQAGKQQDKVQQISEEGLTNAIVKLTHGTEKKIYFTVGHGEADIKDTEGKGYSQVVKALADEGIQSAPLNLLDTKDIPQDAAAVVVAGPQKQFLDAEVSALKDYASKGGHLIVELDPQVDSGLDPLLKSVGIQANNDEIIDPLSRLAGADLDIPVVQQYAQNSPITKDFTEATLFPTCRSLTALNEPERPLALATTNPSAWGETDFTMLAQGRANPEGKLKGSLAVALAATKKIPPAEAGRRSPEMRLVAFGNSAFANNRWGRQVGNQDLFMNTVSWMTDSNDRITIRPRSREASHLAMSQQQMGWVYFFSADLLPVTLLAVGVAIWLVRRAK